jgi:anti-sigma factor RsiW
MECGIARKYLYLRGGPGSASHTFLAEIEVSKAREHVARCAGCKEFFAAEERIVALVGEHTQREKVTASFREKLLAAVARERRKHSGASRFQRLMLRRSLIAGAACLLLIAAVVGFWLVRGRARVAREPLASVLIDDHAHTFPSEAQITSSNSEEVRLWFEDKVGFSFRLPPLRDPALTGGRLCNLRGRLAALVYYQQPQSRVSLFVLEATGVELPEDRLIALDGKRCLVDTKRGYNAVLWEDRGLVYGLVSDARSNELLQLAAQF